MDRCRESDAPAELYWAAVKRPQALRMGPAAEQSSAGASSSRFLLLTLRNVEFGASGLRAALKLNRVAVVHLEQVDDGLVGESG